MDKIEALRPEIGAEAVRKIRQKLGGQVVYIRRSESTERDPERNRNIHYRYLILRKSLTYTRAIQVLVDEFCLGERRIRQIVAAGEKRNESKNQSP